MFCLGFSCVWRLMAGKENVVSDKRGESKVS